MTTCTYYYAKSLQLIWIIMYFIDEKAFFIINIFINIFYNIT